MPYQPVHIKAVCVVNSGVFGDKAVRGGRHLKKYNVTGGADSFVIDKSVHKFVLQWGVVSLVVYYEK